MSKLKLFPTLRWWHCIVALLSLSACSNSLKNYNAEKKYASNELHSDYRQMKTVLEAKHPSLYWYTDKDSMDFYFRYYENKIPDSMTERDFVWKILAPLVNKIHCGHTGAGMSRNYEKWATNRKFSLFPLMLKVWNDTMAVTGNMLPKDTIFKRGTIITAINDMPAKTIIHEMLDALREDGYAHNVNYIRISGSFPVLHRNLYGLSKQYKIQYLDSMGVDHVAILPLYEPAKDSSENKKTTRNIRNVVKKTSRLQRKRSLLTDSSGTYSVMQLNSFSGWDLRHFFRKSFRNLKNEKIKHLVIDLRNNGGGDVNTSILFTKYLSNQPFRITDSCYSFTRNLKPYTGMFSGKWLLNLQWLLLTRKNKDGNFHLNIYEKKLYRPKKKNHYNGKVYVLINGPTFSASTLFANIVKGQKNIQLVGEETGGGWYGNNGIMIPRFTLKNTKIQVRIPLFRVVQYQHGIKDGKGIPPDIFIPTDYEYLKKGADKKMDVVKQLIIESEEYIKH